MIAYQALPPPRPPAPTHRPAVHTLALKPSCTRRLGPVPPLLSLAGVKWSGRE